MPGALDTSIVCAKTDNSPVKGAHDANESTLRQCARGNLESRLVAALEKVDSEAAKVTFAFKNFGGKAAKLVVTFKKTGTYRYLCIVPGHAAAGMKGVFAVR